MVARPSCCKTTTSTRHRRVAPSTTKTTVDAVTRRPSVSSTSKKTGEAGRPVTRTRVVSRKIQALRRLVPEHGSREEDGLDVLLFDAANYILRLQMQVKVMQIMVNVIKPKDC